MGREVLNFPDGLKLNMTIAQKPTAPFRIKICGIRTVQEAEAVAESGADAIGLNFFERSKRFVEIEQATLISEKMRRLGIAVVGLFVNSPLTNVLTVAEKVRLDVVQLHGDENSDFLDRVRTGIPNIKVIKAIRLPADGSIRLSEFLRQGNWSSAPDAWLVDAGIPGEYGGTGAIGAWDSIELEHGQVHFGDQFEGCEKLVAPVILAGGLTPENVISAILRVQPTGVDVASGVENESGAKDSARAAQFVLNAKKGLEMVKLKGLRI